MPTMSNISSMVLTQEQVLGTSVLILVGQKLLREYKNNVVTDNIIGIRVEVVSPAKCFERFSVKIPGIELLDISDEAIAEACKSNPIYVKFNGFTAKLYNGFNNTVNISCSATGIEIVTQEKKKGGD